VDLSQAHESIKSAEEALLNRDQVIKGLRTQLETSEGKLSSTRIEAEGDKARLERIEASLRQETVRADGAKARSDKLEEVLLNTLSPHTHANMHALNHKP
jgi:chromosome segregation ATPase